MLIATEVADGHKRFGLVQYRTRFTAAIVLIPLALLPPPPSQHSTGISGNMDVSWLPPQGQAEVKVGPSLGRWLRAKRGESNPPRKTPGRNFHLMRYNFKPASVDPMAPGTIETKKGNKGASVSVERASTQAGDNHLFQGSEEPAQEWDCVLIYDEDQNSWTLEKLDTNITLQYERRLTGSAGRSNASPAASTPSQASTSKEPVQISSLDEEIERELLGTDVDADGEVEDDIEKVISAAVEASASKPPPRKEEEEEEEEGEIPLSALLSDPPRKGVPPPPKKPVVSEPSSGRLLPSKPPAPKASTAKSTASKPPPSKPPASRPPEPKPALSNPTPPAPTASHAPSKPTPSPAKGKGKREHPVDSAPSRTNDLEEEVLEFGVPARPTKRAKASPTEGLALPTSKSAPAPISLALPSPSTAPSLPSAPPAPVTSSVMPEYSDSEEDNDDDWEPVSATPVPPPAPAEEEGGAEDEGNAEELFDDLLTAELDDVLSNKDDDLDSFAAELEEAAGSPAKVPMSLNQLAGGAPLDDDDYSSTDESEDDD
ncbi:hypothetical protein GLOTRDRAFT_136482 [Gloeophyllum trabeum ATCC 11539]|uniref:Transcription elongation factor Eaf N-terminal domain-containing protein n=1 Tax=Gloeophyllum trabeum (strain ATCC 11539 / FP-39264 / Madison 617) TaxID=670483 RepID=S7QJ34_GLOTA|nr:uncharacterized protein GLOTRDRAFT_136482 [Gloeophyllum trabeum ATCC 11539]EPQ59666.1 hypothetical protein GLOTRDRAFT_136482 [Gloeophyllum trabeum ATCC 11539]